MNTDFDKFKHVQYEPIQKLFWDIYPYKVSLKDQYEKPENVYIWNDPTAYEAWKAYRTKRRGFYNKLRRSCPEKGWKAMDNGTSFSFFFEDRKVATDFIAKHKKYVRTVFRAENPEQITALSANKDLKIKLVLRDALYYRGIKNKGYTYCIEFNEQFRAEDERELDELMVGMLEGWGVTAKKSFHKRAYYTYSKRRRLYLRDEKDIMNVILMAKEHIRSFSQVLLKSDV